MSMVFFDYAPYILGYPRWKPQCSSYVYPIFYPLVPVMILRVSKVFHNYPNILHYWWYHEYCWNIGGTMYNQLSWLYNRYRLIKIIIAIIYQSILTPSKFDYLCDISLEVEPEYDLRMCSVSSISHYKSIQCNYTILTESLFRYCSTFITGLKRL